MPENGFYAISRIIDLPQQSIAVLIAELDDGHPRAPFVPFA
jgi:hypothetical protein